MKKIFFILAVFCVLKANAQNYLISFTGSKIPVNTIIVENLTSGTSLTLNGSDILNLKGNTGTTGIDDNRLSSGIKIYPNPMVDNTTVEFYPPVSGNTTISIFDMSGKLITQLQNYLENSKQEFKVTGEGKGLYIVNIRGINYRLSGKLICNGDLVGKLNIEKISVNQIAEEKTSKNESKGTQGIIDMLYLPGNRLKFTAISGSYKTILTDIPDQNKTIVFDLMDCKDGDNNNYSLVEIGNQTWMEQNLKTTKYKDGVPIPLVENNTSWFNLSTPGYSFYNNDVTNKNIYGALYNWNSVNTTNLCPAGWHIPTQSEHLSLVDFLKVNDYGYYYEGYLSVGGNIMFNGLYIGKSLAAKSGWAIYGGPGMVGNDQSSNNSSGFSGLPGGERSFNGNFISVGDVGAWWLSTTEISNNYEFTYGFGIQNNARYDYTMISELKNSGYSVRCLKD